MPTPAAILDRRMRQLGSDLALNYPGPSGLWEDVDLRSAGLKRRDLQLVDRLDAADQLLVNRIKTRQGELTPLGHPEYGSRHHTLIGEPNVERTRQLIKLYILECLSHEPRIEKVLRCDVFPDQHPPRSMVRIEIDVRLLYEPNPLNLVVPFSLEV